MSRELPKPDEVKTGIDWKKVKDALDAEDWGERDDGDDSMQERSTFLGTVFGLWPSGKYYTPWANSNVDACPQCGGRGHRLKRHQTLRRLKKWEHILDRMRTIFWKRGYIGHPEKIDNSAIGRTCRRVQKLKETIHCDHCGGLGSHEAYLDQIYGEKLEEEAEEHGYFIFNGEGDPCDVFAGESRDTPEKLEDGHYEGLERADMVKLLEGISIQCYDNETDEVLREAVKANVEDGSIDPEAVWEVIEGESQPEP